MNNEKTIKSIFYLLLLIIFLGFTINAMAQTELPPIINDICLQRHIAKEGSFVTPKAFKHKSGTIMVFPKPHPSTDITSHVSNLSKWPPNSIDFATICLQLIPPKVLTEPMLKHFVSTCEIKAGDAKVTEKNIKEALVALTSCNKLLPACNNNPACMMQGVDLTKLPVDLSTLQLFVNPVTGDSRADYVPADVVKP